MGSESSDAGGGRASSGQGPPPLHSRGPSSWVSRDSAPWVVLTPTFLHEAPHRLGQSPSCQWHSARGRTQWQAALPDYLTAWLALLTICLSDCPWSLWRGNISLLPFFCASPDAFSPLIGYSSSQKSRLFFITQKSDKLYNLRPLSSIGHCIYGLTTLGLHGEGAARLVTAFPVASESRVQVCVLRQ